MSNQIIIINGGGGCGKSTFAQFCAQAYNEMPNNIKVYELSTVDRVKEIASFCGWDGTKTSENRAFLHNLKMVLKEWNNLPNQSVIDEIAELNKQDTQNIYFVNIREKAEILNFIELAQTLNIPVKTLLVENPQQISNESAELLADIHSTEYDILIRNDGTLEDLYQKALKFMYCITTMPQLFGITLIAF